MFMLYLISLYWLLPVEQDNLSLYKPAAYPHGGDGDVSLPDFFPSHENKKVSVGYLRYDMITKQGRIIVKLKLIENSAMYVTGSD
jgi:hypothetical protein